MRVTLRYRYAVLTRRWVRRWRFPLAAALVLVWIPVVIYLSRDYYVAQGFSRQDFFWLPPALFPEEGDWVTPLMSFNYNLEYYSLVLRRLFGVAAAVGLAGGYLALSTGSISPTESYAALRRAVRRAVYRWLGALLLLPSLAASLTYHIGAEPTANRISAAVFPALLITADWFSLSEFVQWLVLRFRGRRYLWYFGWAILLFVAYYFANFYIPQTADWGRAHLFSGYPAFINILLIVFSLGTALAWWWFARKPSAGFLEEFAATPVSGDTESGLDKLVVKEVSRLVDSLNQHWPRVLTVSLAVLFFLAVGWLIVLRSGVLVDPDRYLLPDDGAPVISTRNHCHYGKLAPRIGDYSYDIEGLLPGMTGGATAPEDLLIVVHGFNNRPLKAKYKFDLARSSAEANGFTGVVAGWSWDADTQHDILGTTGYHTGDQHSALNGPKLAKFVIDYKQRNPGVRIHVIGYSMGCRAALEALNALHNDPGLSMSAAIIDTVHLLGASVDNEDVEIGEKYGEAIEGRCGRFFNYHSRKDVALGAFYWLKESDRSLGEVGIEHPRRGPGNYIEVDAAAELCTYDDEFNVVEEKMGYNHKGYLGNKDPAGQMLDDGALNLVVENIGNYRLDR